ncbi:MAG: DarT ssDNA thymidine ADP-ribosyltransferase family protein [Pseudomonas sp.]
MPGIREQKLLYHLTSIENLSSIFQNGLRPRAQLDTFTDVADAEILSKRKTLGLEQYVPFHWFAANPFDGSVQRSRPDSQFAVISVHRNFAIKNRWKVIPHHPLADDGIQLLEYAEGFEAINWDVMNVRDYHDPRCKSICMAECLSPDVVSAGDFFKIFVSNAEVEALCEAKMREAGVTVQIGVNRGMFLR